MFCPGIIVMGLLALKAVGGTSTLSRLDPSSTHAPKSKRSKLTYGGVGVIPKGCEGEPLAKSISGLKITDLILGQGSLAEQGKVATIHYRSFLNHGEQFRS